MRTTRQRLGVAGLTLALMAGMAMPTLAQDAAAIDFGDDSSEWSKDGECDDPRFTGSAMAAELEDIDTGKDATDCKAAFEAGTISLIDAAAEPATDARPASDDEIDFGDDSSTWSKDGECDDPRFAGSAMAGELLASDTGRDATDCKAAFDAGTITFIGANNSITPIDDIDFGDDASEWSKDLECDDPRFAGSGMATYPSDEDRMHDASDCRQAYEDGTITLAEEASDPAPMSKTNSTMLEMLANRIDFGDDESTWSNDGECDDPDFFGSGVVSEPEDRDRMHDATDCRAAFLAGTAALKSGTNLGGAFDYGTDSSDWANDGQCDDRRFTGPGMAKKLNSEDEGADASDCRALEEAGEVSIKPVFQPDYVLGAPYDSSAINFGDNSSPYSDDGQCDDPRFDGPGVASTLLDSDREADANDCKSAFEMGRITLRDGES